MASTVADEIRLLESGASGEKFTTPSWSKDHIDDLLKKLKRRFPNEAVSFYPGQDKAIHIGETSWLLVDKYFCDVNGGQLHQLSGSDHFYRRISETPVKYQRYRGRPYERYRLTVDSTVLRDIGFSNHRDLIQGIAIVLALA